MITARFLEKRRMRTATVMHALLFAVILSLYLFLPNGGGFAALGERIFSHEAYCAIQDALNARTPFFGVCLSAVGVIEAVLFLLAVVAAIVLFVQLTESAAVTLKDIFGAPSAEGVRPYRRPFFVGRIFLRYCRLLN